MQSFATKPRILLVDDEVEMLSLLGAEFSESGFEVFTAGKVATALEILSHHKVDVVLSDIRMPGASGMDFFKELKTFGESRPHFVFMSGFSDVDTSEAYDVGAAGILTKPFQTQKAIEAVQYLLGPRLQNWSAPYRGKLPWHQIRKLISSFNDFGVSTDFKLGRGGFFVKLPPEEIPPSRELVSFRIDFETQESPFQGIGKVRWVRSRSNMSYPSGCGVEILHLIESSREQITQFLEKNKPDAIIPAA